MMWRFSSPSGDVAHLVIAAPDVDVRDSRTLCGRIPSGYQLIFDGDDVTACKHCERAWIKVTGAVIH